MSRISELIRLRRHIYHTKDLASIWKIDNKRTLYNAIQRGIKAGWFKQVYKGIYSTVDIDTLDEVEVGASICPTYCYMSTESVLAREGWITQIVFQSTFVTLKPRRTKAGNREFYYRQLADRFLFNQTGVMRTEHGFVATPERAVADLLYFAPKYHFDMREFINWDQVNLIRKQVGYP